MGDTVNSEILSGIAERILDELYDAAVKEPQIMVCDWRAYALLEAYRKYASIVEDIPIPDIEKCFSGVLVPVELRFYRRWRVLGEWHECHRQRSCEPSWEAFYERYLDKPVLKLRSYTLSL